MHAGAGLQELRSSAAEAAMPFPRPSIHASSLQSTLSSTPPTSRLLPQDTDAGLQKLRSSAAEAAMERQRVMEEVKEAVARRVAAEAAAAGGGAAPAHTRQ